MSSNVIRDEKDPCHSSAEAIASAAPIGAVGGAVLGCWEGGFYPGRDR